MWPTNQLREWSAAMMSITESQHCLDITSETNKHQNLIRVRRSIDSGATSVALTKKIESFLRFVPDMKALHEYKAVVPQQTWLIIIS